MIGYNVFKLRVTNSKDVILMLYINMSSLKPYFTCYMFYSNLFIWLWASSNWLIETQKSDLGGWDYVQIDLKANTSIVYNFVVFSTKISDSILGKYNHGTINTVVLVVPWYNW